jgi:hypothetical protein
MTSSILVSSSFCISLRFCARTDAHHCGDVNEMVRDGLFAICYSCRISPFRPPPSSNASRCRPPPAASTLRSTCYGGRAGWVAFFHPQTRHKAGAFPGKKGTCCNFNLSRIPAEARIEVVRTVERQGRARSPSEPRRDRDIAPYQQTVIVPPAEVRKRFKRIKPLKEISVTQRGESKTPKAPARDVYRSSGLDVLNIVRRISEGRATRVPNISGKSLPHIGY